MTWHRFAPWALASLLALLAGCATHLAPAPEAVRLGHGPRASAVAEAEGVRVIARADAWRGDPEGLEFEVTPVLVAIQNDGARPVRLRYEQFALVGPAGTRFAALSPFDVEGVVVEREPYPSAFPRLAYAPYRVDPHGRFGLGYPYAWDPFYWDYYATRRVRLPTGDMVQKALPETTVEPGATMRGFLYFEEVKDVDAVTLRAELVDARTGQPFASVAIPFVVE